MHRLDYWVCCWWLLEFVAIPSAYQCPSLAIHPRLLDDFEKKISKLIHAKTTKSNLYTYMDAAWQRFHRQLIQRSNRAEKCTYSWNDKWAYRFPHCQSNRILLSILWNNFQDYCQYIGKMLRLNVQNSLENIWADFLKFWFFFEK